MILIFRDQGGEYDPEEYEIVGEYDPEAGEWVTDEHDFETFYPSGTDPEVLLRQLDGPSYIAVDAEGSVMKRVTGPVGPTHAQTLADFGVVEDEAEPPDGEDRDEERQWEEVHGKEERRWDIGDVHEDEEDDL